LTARCPGTSKVVAVSMMIDCSNTLIVTPNVGGNRRAALPLATKKARAGASG